MPEVKARPISTGVKIGGLTFVLATLSWLGPFSIDSYLPSLPSISQGLHAYLKEKDIPHVWHVDGNAHDPTEWRNNLYHFSQRIFR